MLWGVAHRVVHGPRGWPMEVPGEWDLLLTSLAVAAGDAPDAAIGTLHGHELGSYLVAALVALPVAFGAAPVAAAKWVALLFGAASAGVLSGLAAALALDEAPRRSAVLAALATACVVAFAWPGLHFELAGVNGRTPEALLPQLIAVALVVTATPVRLPLRASVAGAAAGLGILLSPVALWTAAACGVAALVRVPRRFWLATALSSTAGLLLPFLLFGLLVPGGWEGLRLFAVEQFGGGLAVSDAASGTPVGLALFGQVTAALEGGAHNPDLALRPVVLGALSWGALAALVAGLLLPAPDADPSRPRWHRFTRPRVLASAIGLSWLVPLVLLPSDKWFYPLAYRYWLVLLGLGLAVGVSLLARRTWPAVLPLVAALLLAPTLPRSIVAPAPSRAEALVSSGAHRLNGRPGRPRDAAFLALAPHLEGADALALAEGYGLALGGDFAVDQRDANARSGGPPVERPWERLGHLDSASLTALRIGVGCGVTAVGTVPPGVTEALARADGSEAFLWGLGRCSVDPGRQPPPGLADGALDSVHGDDREAFDAGRASRPWRTLRSQAANPAQWMPPRW